MSRDEKIPVYYALFIVMALLPQIFGYNGTIIDSVFKFVLICSLLLLLVDKYIVVNIGNFGVIYLVATFFSRLLIFIASNDSVFVSIENFLITILLFYLLYVKPSYTILQREKSILSFYKIYVYFIVISCIYNMIIHFNSLLHITSLTIYNTENIASFFDNKNTFGVFLLFAVLGSTILKFKTKEFKWSVFILLFIINELMAMCRTAIVISICLLLLCFFIGSKNIIRNIFIFLSIVVLFVIFMMNNDAFNSYINTILGNTKSLESRNEYVQNMLPLINNGGHFIWGYGDQQATQLASEFTGNQYYHNTYLKLLITGGVLKFLLHLSILFISIKYGIKVYLNDRITGILCLVSTLVYIIYAFIESVIIFDTPVVAILASMFVVTMPILFYNTIGENNERSNK